jgi:phosphoglycerate dehydrogenase-like enzyme
MSKDLHTKVAVCSRSFSRNEILRKELLEEYQHVTFNDKGISLIGDKLEHFLKGQDKAIIALEPITDQLLCKLPELKVISKYGVGLNNLSKSDLIKHSIKLGWEGGVNKRAVAELTIGFMLSLMRDLSNHGTNLRNNIWEPKVGKDLSSQTVGIVGCGHIGKELVRLLQPFGCKILVNDILQDQEFYSDFSMEVVSKDELLSQSDIVSLHIPLCDSTNYFISKDELSKMKKSAVLINCARGGLVNEEHLFESLKENRIAGAYFDVFDIEPCNNNNLLGLMNFHATPHLGGSTIESILKMGRSAIRGLSSYKNLNEINDLI